MVPLTGITPALGENVVEICKEACIKAKEKGVKNIADYVIENSKDGILPQLLKILDDAIK